MKTIRLPLTQIRTEMQFLLDHVHDIEMMQHDKVVRYAVERSFTIIGEATKRIPEEERVKYPSIPWQEMAGMRDRVVHEYDEIDLNVIWKTIQNDIPSVLPEIDRILEDDTL